MSVTKVIIFEDEFLLANDLKRQISDHGYEVTAIFRKAEDGLDYLRKLESKEDFPEVILMDISLAGKMNGIEAAEAISGHFPCALVFLSGMSQLEIFEDAYRSKPHAFLIKPFDIHQALVSIKLALYQKNLENSLLHYQNELENKIIERTQELREAKESAVKAIQLKNEILTNISKQIRDPMCGIKGTVAILEEKSREMPDFQRYLKNMDDNLEHLFSLLNEIMNLNHDNQPFMSS
ncbi:MAG: response regulator [Bacteroidales bacterium]|nr:response regulator [Bacteroidales bacterium]